MENNKLPLYELLINDASNVSEGVESISFVENPAIEEDFMFFSKPEESYKFAEKEDKYLVTGPAMIPNQKIYRIDGRKEFDVFFSEETIAKCNELFFKNSNIKESNIDHNPTKIDGVTVIESWLVEDPTKDKSTALGFTGFPKGTWMVTYKVDNKDLWSKIKSGEVKGFSIEGYFINKLIEMQTTEIDVVTEIESIIFNDTLSADEQFDMISKIIS